MSPFDLVFHILLGIGLFFFSASITKFMIRINIEDKPNARSSHTKSTPRSGGVAIVLSFTIGALLIKLLQEDFSLPPLQLIAVLSGGFLMALIAFLDDLKGMKQIVKFGGQLLSIAIMLGAGLYFELLTFLSNEPIILGPVLGIGITLVWLLFFMNGFNFMDGLNGIASGSGMIAGIFMCILGFLAEDYVTFGLSLTLVFSILGFFVFNFPGGKIFMGDVGSQYLAIILAMIGIIASRNQSFFISEMSIPFLMFMFVFDVLWTLIKRIFKKENIFEAHKSHLYQRLHQSGFTHIQVTIVHLFFVCLGGSGVLFIYNKGPLASRIVFLILLTIALCYAFWVYRRFKKAKPNEDF